MMRLPAGEGRGLVRRLGIVLGVAVVIGLTNHATDTTGQRSLAAALVYALAVSLLIWLCIDVARYPLARLLRLRAPRYWPQGWGAVAWTVGGIALGYLGGTAIGDAYLGRSTWDLLRLDPARFVAILAGAAGVALAFVAFFYQRSRAEILARQAREAELRLLQSQLEPHMLFNTLANLRVLIALDPPRAQAMLDRLIAFLRATLAASRAGTHTLGDEFARLSDYLALMAVRMGPRLQVQLTLPPELGTRPVPALLLQPLAENAIAHGLEPQVSGGRLEIGAEALPGGRLRLRVRDTGVGWRAGRDAPAAPQPGAPAGGFGLTQVRERLATRYGAAARFTIGAAEGGGTEALIELPPETAP